MSTLRTVVLVVSAQKTPDTYAARSYPDDDYDNNGKIELYGTPVFKVFIQGTDTNGKAVSHEWKALRFMPYWNDPKSPSPKYKSLGWVNSGKWQVAKKAVKRYDPTYGTHNRYSPYGGAIEIDGAFLIHAGPNDLSDSGWGAAGCVEIIGNFDDFKDQIKVLSGSTATEADVAILDLVKQRKLFIHVESARAPNLKASFLREE